VKQIEKQFENEYETKETEIVNKCSISVDREIIMCNTENYHQDRKNEVKLGRCKIENTPFFAIADRLIK